MYLKSPESIKVAFESGDPRITFIKGYLDQWYSGDALGPAQALYVWAMTGLEEHRAKAELFEIPYYGEYGHYRQEGLDALMHVKLMQDHGNVSQATRDRWETGIKRMCTSAIRRLRSWDADERECTLPFLAICDLWYGTWFMTAAERTDITSMYYVEWETVPQLLDMWNQALADFVDGATSESIGYMINTQNKKLIAVMIAGKDILPGIREWLPKFRKFLLWGISNNLEWSLVYGDQQEALDPWYALFLYYRQPLYLTMAAIDEDPDGQLEALSKALTDKYNFYFPLYWHWALGLDFTKVQQQLTLEQGHTHFHPGITIFRQDKIYLQIVGTTWTHDDHDAYASGGADHRLCVGSDKFVDRPSGYSAHWTEHNGLGMRGHSWLPDRKTLSSEFVDGKVRTKYEQRGPVQATWWMDPNDPAYPPLDYVDCWWTKEVEFDPITLNLNVSYKWHHNGVFPDYPEYYYKWMWEYAPIEIQFCPTPNLVLDQELKQASWVTALGQEMLLSYSGEENVAVVPYVFRNVEHFKLTRLKSTVHDGTVNLVYAVGAYVGPPPPPPLPPPGVFDEAVPDEQLPEPAVLILVDNLSLGYSATGPWTRFSPQGVDGAVDYIGPGDGTAKAEWKARVTPGLYNVAVTWEPYDNRATDSKFVVKRRSDGAVLAEVRVNQELPPQSFNHDLWYWHTLADVTVAADDVLIVELTNDANDHVIADAVRFERLSAPPPPPPQPPTDKPANPFWRMLEGGKKELVFPEP